MLMGRRTLLQAAFCTVLALPVWADARMSALVDTMQLPQIMQILRDEGLAQADDLDQEFLSGRGGSGWQVQVDAIYDPQRMVETLRSRLEAELQGEDREAAIAFFASDLGTVIIGLENAARAAIDVRIAIFQKVKRLNTT